MLLWELFEREDVSAAVVPRVGAKHVVIEPTPEEQRLFDRAGVKTFRDMYVVYAYLEPIAGNQDMQDRLKLRAGHNDEQYVRDVVDNGINAIMKTNAAKMDHKWGQTRGAIEMFQRWISSTRGNLVIVPLPSSSKTVHLVADAIARRTNAPIVDVLEKNPYPSVSHELVSGLNRKPYDYAGAKASMDRLEQEINQALERDDVEGYERLTSEYNKQKAKLKTYSRKHHMLDSGSLYGKAYYQTIRARGDAELSRLRDTYVLFVDDNVVSGHTVADAIKDLLAKGIRPKGILGFAPHHFTSVRPQ